MPDQDPITEPAAQSPLAKPRRTRLVLKEPPRRSRRKKLWLAVGFLALFGFNAAVVGSLVLYAMFSAGLPALPSVEEYRPPVLSEFWTDDRVLAGEFYHERRKVVAFDKIPKRLVQAFIAAEDDRFFDHPGFDLIATGRAAFTTYVMRHGVKGGSSLTQQAAKAVLVSVELSKVKDEDVVAEARRRLSSRPITESADAVQEEEQRVKAENEAQVAAAVQARIDADARAIEAKVKGEAPPPPPAKKPGPPIKRLTDAQIHAQALKRLEGKTLADHLDSMRNEMLRVSAQMRAQAHARATEKTIRRKIRELILAVRLERALSKDQILYLYLNNVFLGHHSYGVQSAAENYFRKDVSNLTLGEMALLAGLPQAPSKYSPFVRPENAKKRRHYVLGRMASEKMISKAEAEAASEEKITVYPVEDVFREFAPFFTEQVRRDVVARYGNERLLKDGLKVYLTMDAERQRAAQVAMLDGLLRVDKRQGFVGPLANLKTESDRLAFEQKIAKKLGDEKLTVGSFYVGLVEKIENEGTLATVNVGGQRAKLPLVGTRWARKPNPEAYYPSSLISDLRRALKVGDVVVAKCVDRKRVTDDDEPKLSKELPEEGPFVTLEQEPELQGAIVSVDPKRGYLVAMIGGYDFDASEFNRALQACRQPGSSFKPIVYSAAIELLNWQVNQILVDSPIVFDDPDNQLRWKPENFGMDFKGDVLLRTALVNSMNIPAVKTLHAVGVTAAAEWAHKLGITTQLNEDLSMALGGSCVKLTDLVNVYATMNRGGLKYKPTILRRVEDRFGRMLEDHTAFDDEFAGFDERVAAGYDKLFDNPERVMKPETAFIINHLMREVVLHGTGAPAQALGKPAAGKTGTTNDSFDTLFMGFTQDLVTGVWLGYDRYEHPLGRYETGGRASLPIWVDYMKRALAARPQHDFGTPPPDAKIVWVRIDADTGKPAPPGSKNAILQPFVEEFEPDATEAEKPGQADPNHLMLIDNP